MTLTSRGIGRGKHPGVAWIIGRSTRKTIIDGVYTLLKQMPSQRTNATPTA